MNSLHSHAAFGLLLLVPWPLVCLDHSWINLLGEPHPVGPAGWAVTPSPSTPLSCSPSHLRGCGTRTPACLPDSDEDYVSYIMIPDVNTEHQAVISRQAEASGSWVVASISNAYRGYNEGSFKLCTQKRNGSLPSETRSPQVSIITSWYSVL